MTGGVVSRGKSRVTRDRTSSPPEGTRKTLSRTTRAYASCPVCSINDTRTAAPQDSSVGDEAQPATELMSTLAAMSTFEPRDIDISTIVAIDRWRATHRTTRCHHVTNALHALFALIEWTACLKKLFAEGNYYTRHGLPRRLADAWHVICFRNRDWVTHVIRGAGREFYQRRVFGHHSRPATLTSSWLCVVSRRKILVDNCTLLWRASLFSNTTRSWRI